MSDISPEYVFKRTGKPITDLNFWNYVQRPCLISSYGGNAGIDLWDMKTRRSVMNLPCDTQVLSACGLRFGEIITFSKEGQLKLVKISDSSPADKVCLSISNAGFCKASVLSQDENAINTIIVAVPGETTSSVNVWDIDNCKIIARLVPPSCFKLGMPMCINLHMNREMIALVGYEDGTILHWNVLEEKVLSKGDSLFKEPVMCIDTCHSVSNEGVFQGISGSATNDLIKWKTHDMVHSNLKSSENSLGNFEVTKSVKIINPGISSLKIRPDQKIIATGGWDHKIRIYSWKSLKPLAVLQYHTSTIQAVSFADHEHNLGQLLACGSKDCKISLWKIYDQP